MIPVRLNMRNFMCYTDVHEPLSFDGIHVAVLSGDNGHGKSALLDAMTWAVWGRSRARSVDELIHSGATEMEVEFEFILDEHQYRVIRKRERRGKGGLSDLQFAVLSNGRYQPLTERSVNETERVIQRTIKMSYETFVNSSYIQQGKADSFTTNQPAERKRILAEILDLAEYDALEAKAKDSLRERELRLRDEQTRTREWEEERVHKADYQADVERLKALREETEKRLQEVEKTCQQARERVARLEAAAQGLAEVGGRITRRAEDARQAEQQLADARRQLAETQAVIARAKKIEADAAQLVDARKALAECDDKFQRYVPLVRTRDAAQAKVRTEHGRLEERARLLLGQEQELRQAAETRPNLEKEWQASKTAAAELAKLDERQQAIQKELLVLREEAGQKREVNHRLKGEMDELRKKLDGLAGLTTCPVCERPVEDAHKDRLRGEYQTQGKALAEAFRANERECKRLDAEIGRLQQEIEALAAKLAGRDAAQKRAAEAASALQQASRAQERLAVLTPEIAKITELLSKEAFAPEARKELAEVEQKLAAVAYDEQAHEGCRRRAQELAAADAELQETQRLDQARVAAEHLTARERELGQALARIAEEGAADEKRRAELAAEQARLKDAAAQRVQLEKQVSEMRAAYDQTREQLTQAQGKLDYCLFIEKRLAESVRLQDTLRREQGIYAELTNAFGKRGVQAMIIDTAIPEIEEEANRLLGRMTDGRMNVKIETQRDTRGPGGTVETLDIKIADELGTRNYEMFSGGEGFRVNFAIRVALSKLLASRAGTALQTLIVDEGFGSQDVEGRDRIVEAIQAIQDEFRKILVITHLEDFRERFPVRIEVEKTPRGSVFSLT